MKPLLIHSEARAELDEAVAYYERHRQGLGLELEAEVSQAFRTIQEDPELGAPYKATDYRFSLLRRFPYVIYYLELPEAIWVVAVAHGRRRPDYWKRRKVEGQP